MVFTPDPVRPDVCYHCGRAIYDHTYHYATFVCLPDLEDTKELIFPAPKEGTPLDHRCPSCKNTGKVVVHDGRAFCRLCGKVEDI